MPIVGSKLMAAFAVATLIASFSSTMALKFVAAANGKSFWADSGSYKRQEAAKFCGGLGAKLASIQSEVEWIALYKAFHSTDFNGEYWTSAMDSVKITQFEWETLKGDTVIDSTFVSYQPSSVGKLQCLVFSVTATKADLINYKCEDTRRVLCETPTNRLLRINV